MTGRYLIIIYHYTIRLRGTTFGASMSMHLQTSVTDVQLAMLERLKLKSRTSYSALMNLEVYVNVIPTWPNIWGEISGSCS